MIGFKSGNRRVTMVDVAREAGCSQTTVSFVLNKSTDVRLSSQTRERVLEAAHRLGYVFAKSSEVAAAPSLA